MKNLSNYPLLYKIFISIILGVLGLLLAPYGIDSVWGTVHVSIPWSILFPLFAALSFGWRFGLLAAISGGALIPFYLWANNGWANVGTFICYCLFYTLIGLSKDVRYLKSIKSHTLRLLTVIFFSIILFTVYDLLLFNYLLSLNPTFWISDTISNLPIDILYGFSFKDSFVLLSMAIVADTLMKLSFMRKIFRIDVYPYMYANTFIFFITFIITILIWLFFVGLGVVFFRGDYALRHEHIMLALLVILTSGIFVARILFFYNKKQYTIKLALNKSEAKYRALFEYATDAIFIIKDGIYIECNPIASKLFGTDLKDIIGKTPSYFSPSYQPDGSFSLEKSQQLIDLALQNKPQLFEWLHKKYDGSFVETDVLLNKLELDNVVVVQAIVRDISERKRAANAIRSSELKHQTIIKTATDGFWLVDTKGYILEVNDAYCKMSGYSKQDLNLMHISNLEVIENQYETQEHVKNVITKGNDRFETVHKRKDGSLFDVEINVQFHSFDGGQIVVFLKDITERKEAQERTRKIGQHYQSLIEKAPDGIVLLDNEGNFKFVSPAARKIFGYNATEAIAGNPAMLTHPDDLTTLLSHLEQLLADPSYVPTLQYRFIDKSGKWIWIESTFSNLLHDSNVESIVINFRDITERKHAEFLLHEQNEALKLANEALIEAKVKIEESEIKYKQIFDNTSDLLYIYEVTEDNRYRVLTFNPAEEKLIGNIELYQNKYIDECIPNELYKQFIPGYERCIYEEQSIAFEENILFQDLKKSFYTQLIPLKNIEGRVYRIIGISRDITEIKQLTDELISHNEQLTKLNDDLSKAKEKAEESDRLKTAFLQNMSHEIRTPMNAIMGFSSLLVKNYNNKPKLEKFSDIIRQRCNDLLDLINDILDIAKIESGQLTLHNEECNLKELFAELTLFFAEHQARIGKKHINFSLGCDCNLTDEIIIVDKLKLKQIFINLIGNAFKFTNEGSIYGGCRLDLNNDIEFYVSDTGIGIPADKQNIIFNRFAQVENGSIKNYGGTGLGLSIVKGLVELLGGSIRVESEVHKGSVFSFNFAFKSINNPSTEVKELVSSTSYNFTNKTILLVEDDRYNAEYIKEILETSGLLIVHAENGKDAIQCALNEDIDLILMDIRLPDIDGYQATRLILEQKPEMKIIAQTAYASNDEKIKALKAGCIDYISKPTEGILLLDLIEKNIR